MKHVKLVSQRPAVSAIDLTDLPVDITFLIDLMDAFIEKKASLTS